MYYAYTSITSLMGNDLARIIAVHGPRCPSRDGNLPNENKESNDFPNPPGP